MEETTEKLRCLVIGGTGMLGHKLVQVLGGRFEVWTTIRRRYAEVEHFGIFDRSRTIDQIDARDAEALRSAIVSARPDAVINAVGVIKQVSASQDRLDMIRLNAVLPHKLAELTQEFGFRLISISTDCVFSGNSGNYGEQDPADATDAYGKSKYLGEVAGDNCLTLRTSMIGRELGSSNSLLEWMLSNHGGEVRGFVDAIFSGLSTVKLSKIISELIYRNLLRSGLYHVSSEPVSKLELLKMIDREFQTGIRIVPDDKLKIDRSLNSDRFWTKTGLSAPTWPEMISGLKNDPTLYDEFRRRALDLST